MNWCRAPDVLWTRFFTGTLVLHQATGGGVYPTLQRQDDTWTGDVSIRAAEAQTRSKVLNLVF